VEHLAEQIRNTLSSHFQTTTKADAALRRVCEKAVACALLLRSSSDYSWEQWEGEAAHRSLVDANEVQPTGLFINQVMSSNERELAFTVFGAVTKNYSVVEYGELIEGKVVITKPVFVLY